MILVGIPAVVGLSLLSWQVMILFSTPDYVQGAVIIPLVAAGGFLLGLQWIAQRGMILANKTVRIMVLYSVAGLSNIIANLLLVPKMGYIAAAWTTFVCYLFLLLLIALGSAPYLTWHVPIRSVMRSLAGCLVMGLAILFIESLHLNSVFVEVLACVAVSVAIYGIVLTLTGELPAKRLLSLVRGRGALPADV